MAISDDLRSVQAVLGSIQTHQAQGNQFLVRLLCDNLMALAEQVEALESLPVALSSPDSFLDADTFLGSAYVQPGALPLQ